MSAKDKGRYYRLDGHRPVPCNFIEWAMAMRDEKARRVAWDDFGDVQVSTVFLGLNHAWAPDTPPLLFETMAFGGALNEEMERCSTWEQAESMHERMCARVRESLGLPQPEHSEARGEALAALGRAMASARQAHGKE